MSQKPLETLVRELQKTVTLLSNKVSSLEAKISEQNALLVNQSKIINNISDCGSRDSVSTPPPAAAAPALKLIRQARLKAATALKAGSSQRRSSPSTHQAGADSSTKPAEGGRVSASASPTTPTVPTARAPANYAAAASKPAGAVATERTLQTMPNQADNDAGPWETVSRPKRRKKQQTIIVGTGSEDNELQTVETIKYLQAWSFRPETTEENIKYFLNKEVKSDDYFVEKRIIKTDRHASFVIGIPESLFTRFKSPVVWPPGVKLTDWFQRRPRGSQEWRRGDSKNRSDECPTPRAQ